MTKAIDSLVTFSNNNEGFIQLVGIVVAGLVAFLVAYVNNKKTYNKNKYVNRDKTIDVSSGGGLVVGLLGGCVSAPGFSDFQYKEPRMDSMDWTFQIKVVNPSKKHVAVMDIRSSFRGKWWYGAESRFSTVHRINEIVLKKPKGAGEHYPILIEPESEALLYVTTNLFTHRSFLGFKRAQYFMRKQVDTETYEKIRQKTEIILTTNEGKIKLNF